MKLSGSNVLRWVTRSPREATLVVVTMGLAAYLVLANLPRRVASEPLPIVADRVYAQLLSGDPTGLFPMIVPNEVETMNLTSDRFDLLVKWAHDQLAGYRQEPGRLDQKAAYEGLFTRATLKDQKGHVVTFEVPVFPTKDGPKVFVSSIMFAALAAKRLERYESLPREIAFVRASRDTIAEERPTLDRICKGLPESQGMVKARLITWDELSRQLKEQENYYLKSQPK